MYNHYTVQKVTNVLSNMIYYNDELFRDVGQGTDTILTYRALPDLAKVYPYEDINHSIEEYAEHNSPVYAPLAVNFSQSST